LIDPSQHFTEQARGVLRRAEEAARAQHVTYVGVEHVMLGLISDEASAATRALVSLGVDLTHLRSMLEAIGEDAAAPKGDLAVVTPRAQRILQRAKNEVSNLGRQDVGPEHLLLSIVREAESVPAQALTLFGVSAPEQVSYEVFRHLAWPPS
jgi:ATP-dependent Clp protease ATP-binding subunit ClpC